MDVEVGVAEASFDGALAPLAYRAETVNVYVVPVANPDMP